MAVDGKYKIEIDSPMGKQEATLTLKAAGEELSGTMESAMGKMDFSGGTVKGDEVFWNTEINSPMGKMELAYKGKVTGNDISGEVQAGNFGSSPFKGKKA
jgi:hypothetical protein